MLPFGQFKNNYCEDENGLNEMKVGLAGRKRERAKEGTQVETHCSIETLFPNPPNSH
jgi:hypothetical protein